MHKGIKWSLNIPPEVTTEYTGAKLGEYFLDPNVQMEVQLESEQIFNRLFKLPIRRIISPTVGSYLSASLLGAELVYPEDDSPQIRGRRVKSVEDIREVKLGEVMETGLVPMLFSHYNYMVKKTTGTEIRVNVGIGCHGPFTTAVVLRGMDLFLDILLHPEESKLLIKQCTMANIATVKLLEKLAGKKVESMWIGDDYGGMISPELYEKFDYPYLEQIYNMFGNKRCFHCETLKKGHLKFLKMLGISIFDPGISDALEVKDILKGTDVHFTYNLFTVRDMQNGTPDSIRKKYLALVEAGSPEITAEICRETPRENVKAYVDVAREFEG